MAEISWLRNGGDPNYLLSGMILQVPSLKTKSLPPEAGLPKGGQQHLPTLSDSGAMAVSFRE